MQAEQPRPDAGSDEDLFERFRLTREWEALAALARRWHAPAFRVARIVCLNDALAEEAVQDGFVELLAQRSAFAERGPGSFRSWFLLLVTNRARMARRRERRSEWIRRVDTLSFLLRKGMDAPAGPPREEPRDLHAALAQIEERFRTPILLYFMEGLQQQEVASRLGVSQQAISRRIEQGLQRLHTHLDRRRIGQFSKRRMACPLSYSNRPAPSPRRKVSCASAAQPARRPSAPGSKLRTSAGVVRHAGARSSFRAPAPRLRRRCLLPRNPGPQ